MSARAGPGPSGIRPGGSGSGGDGGGFGFGIFMLAIVGAVALVGFTVMLILGVTVVGDVSSSLGSADNPRNVTSSPDPVTGQAVSFADTWGGAEILELYQVNDSTGYAINLTGASNSYVTSRAAFDVATDDTWTACTWARVDPGAASENMSVLSVNGRLNLQYNGSQSNWTAWYFDEGSRNSWRVNVSAPNQPSSFSHVCAWYNSSHLSIYRNTTQGDVVNTSADAAGSSLADLYVNASNFDGRLEETRTFDTTLNASQRQALHNYAIVPLTNATRTSRIMYDEGSGTVTDIYFTSTKADISNGQWAQGIAGTTLSSGSDYEIDLGDGEITALDGGKLDGAPVAWIDYRYKPLSRVGEVSERIAPSFELAGTISLVLPAVVALGMLIAGLVLGVRGMHGLELPEWTEDGRNRGR